MVSEAAHPSSGSRAATSLTSSDLELIEQLKQQLTGSLFAAVSDQFSNFQNTVLSYQNKLQYAELKIRVLEERLRLVRIAKYGPGSEKLSDAQPRRSSPRRKRSASIPGGRNCRRIFRV